MEDQSLFSKNQPKVISEGLQNFIDSMVEEIVLEGKPFDTQKKYLKKFSENEGLDYEKLEADITTFIEILDSLKTAFSKLQVKLAEEKGRECHISEKTVKKLVNHSSLRKLPKKEESPKKGLWIALAVAAVVAVVVVLLWPKNHYKQIDKWMAESERIYSKHHFEEPMDDYTKAIDSLNYGDGLCVKALKAFDEIKDMDSLHMMKRCHCEDLAQLYRSNVEWIVGKEMIRLSIADDTLAAIDRLRQLEKFYFYQHDSTGLLQREAIEKDIDILCNTELLPLQKTKKDRRFGFYDKSGNAVIQPKYDCAYTFSEGLAVVMLNDKYGFVNKLGNMVIERKFDYASSFSEGLAAVELDGMWGFIDKKGNTVIERKYDRAYTFSEGLAAVELDDKWGFIDKTGKTVVERKYDFAYDFSEGLARVKLPNGMWRFIDKKGNTFIESEYNEACNFSEELAGVELDGMWGFIDKKGNTVIERKYDRAYNFSEGLARVKLDGMWGFIDKKGNTVIERKYEDAYNFSEGLARVKLDGMWGFVDKKGNTVIEPEYEDAYPFSEGLAGVKLNGKWGFINKTGKMVIAPQFKYLIDSFRNGLCRVVFDDGTTGCINLSGKVVF